MTADTGAIQLLKASGLFASRVAMRGTQAISFVLLARVLAPESLGLYGLITSAVFLASQLGNLGLRQAAAYMIGQRQLRHGDAALTLTTVWPILAGACIALLWLVVTRRHDDLQHAVHLPVSAAISAAILITLAQGIFLGRGNVAAFGLSEAGPRFLQLTLLIGLSLAGAVTMESALWSFAVGFVAFAPVLLTLAFRSSSRPRLAFSRLPKMIAYGAVFSLSLFAATMQSRVSLFLLGGTAAAGHFFAALSGAEALLEVATVFGLLLFSATARSQSPSLALRTSITTVSALFALFVVIGAASALAAPSLIPLVLGPQYVDSVGTFRILSVGLAPAAVVRVMNSVVGGMGRPYLSLAVVSVGLAGNVILCLLLVPSLAASGAAIALVSGQIVSSLVYILVCRACFQVRFREFLPRLRQFASTSGQAA